MVTPYHVYRLQRLAAVLDEATADDANRTNVTTWLKQFQGGEELLELNDRLADCRVRKEGGRIFSVR